MQPIAKRYYIAHNLIQEFYSKDFMESVWSSSF